LLTPADVLLAVDFEHSAVSQVRKDLLYNSWESGFNRRTFCTAYLKARGLTYNKNEVDRLAVDMILGAVVNFRLLWGLFLPKGGFAGQIEMKACFVGIKSVEQGSGRSRGCPRKMCSLSR
jgi:hypothetical protein